MNTNILIGTPAYNGLLHMDFMNSILDFHKIKLPFSLMMIGNESLISRGRNTILSHFYEMKNFSHLLFIDADIGIKGEDIIKLLQHNVEVIGAPVALKGYDALGNKVYNVTNPIKSTIKTSLFEVDNIGAAVLLLTRNAVESLVDKAVNNNDLYHSNKYSRGNSKDLMMFDVFKTGVVNGIYLSEDYYVCKTLKELGYTIYVDDTVKTVHNGMFQF